MEKENEESSEVYFAAEHGSLEELKESIRRISSEIDWDGIMTSASVSGSEEKVRFCLENGANSYNCSVYFASIGRQDHIINLFVEGYGSELTPASWEFLLTSYGMRGMVEGVDFIFQKGTSYLTNEMINSAAEQTKKAGHAALAWHIAGLRI
jgi:hypothetical protein